VAGEEPDEKIEIKTMKLDELLSLQLI
jgi:hypothetical protein